MNNDKAARGDYVSLRITAELLTKLRLVARQNERTISGQIVYYIKQGLEKERNENVA